MLRDVIVMNHYTGGVRDSVLIHFHNSMNVLLNVHKLHTLCDMGRKGDIGKTRRLMVVSKVNKILSHNEQRG